MAISIVQLGSPRGKKEGVRIGTVRRPPRGVPKGEFASRNYYDTWLPQLAPSEPLVKKARASASPREWHPFVTAYRREMHAAETSRLLDLLAALSHASDFALGCYCEDETHCHRSVLRELLQERGAKMR